MKDVHSPGRKPYHMTHKDASELLMLYETNSTRKLAEKFRVSQTTICKRLKKAKELEENYGKETKAESV
jgi:transcriptional antiterminator